MRVKLAQNAGGDSTRTKNSTRTDSKMALAGLGQGENESKTGGNSTRTGEENRLGGMWVRQGQKCEWE